VRAGRCGRFLRNRKRWSGTSPIISRTNPPQQFDEYVWFDETRAVTPLDTAEIKGLPDTYSFGV